MDIKEQILAKKYATAYLNSFTLSQAEYNILSDVELFLKSNVQFKFIAKLPVSFNDIKRAMIQHILEQFQLSSSFLKLIELLFKQQRLFLLPAIVTVLARVYREQNNIALVVAHISHPINQEEKTIIKNFITKKTNKNIILNTVLDKSLIAGIRLQSESFLWEYSIAQQLNNIERLFDHEHKKF